MTLKQSVCVMKCNYVAVFCGIYIILKFKIAEPF
jgi:hypothetical protein